MSDYKKMPVRKNDKNDWYDKVITNLKLDVDKEEKDLILLNNNNSNIIEPHIKSNENYNAFFYKKIYKYYKALLKSRTVMQANRNCVLDIIKMIDLENSTNIWRYVKSRPYIKRMVDFIVDPKSDFWNDLKSCDQTLVDRLLNYAKAGKASIDGPKSLASKICKYLSELFDSNLDSYYINDSVVRHTLPFYYRYYVNKPIANNCQKLSYTDISKYLDEIANAAFKEHGGKKLKKSELDHIMWYCYRYGKD